MSSKIKQYFANKENRIKCGITGGRNDCIGGHYFCRNGVYGGK